MLDPNLLGAEKQRRLKRSEFAELLRLGLFEGERIELLYGVIVEMSIADPKHGSPIQELTRILVPKLLDRATVRIQMDYVAVEESEPVPDIAIVPLGKYRDEHPDRAYCIIEVANTSLRKDRHVKAPLYAASKVDEYWIVNVNDACIEVFRDSDGRAYQSEKRCGLEEKLSLAAFPDVVVAVSDVLG
jgi:Uma2 family endonuclease